MDINVLKHWVVSLTTYVRKKNERIAETDNRDDINHGN